ncbi:DCD domain-containing protein [Abeliophyllum distichum]|uniref:DCD domain-containing protein n=1 Tax=Abeliophyllum distichum TaxID=126358 RepID=A0ABD1QXP1_9LAMI
MESDEDNGAAGNMPEFGAIFMSNVASKKECFKHKVFALPSSQAKFVKQVKAGMVLFLFEYEKRELFGVYQACSDGAMDIVPHLCNSLGKKFPAQVHFKPIWYCNPLSEKMFQDAIYDNYYSAKKFNFGLSEDQVHRLLLLFSSRKLKNKLPRQPLTKLVNRAVDEERRLMDDDRFALLQRADMQSSEDVFEPGMSRHLGNLLNRPKEPDDDIPFIEDRIDTEDEFNSVAHGLLTGYTSECVNRRTDNDGRLLRSNLSENRLHDSFYKVRRLADGGRLLTGELVNDKFQVDSDLNPIHFREYPVGPLDVKTDDDDKLMMRNRTVGGYDTDIGFGSAHSTEHRGKSLNRNQLGINDNKFLIGGHGEKEYNHHHIVEPAVSNDGNLDERLENRHCMDYFSGSASASERIGSLLHKIRKPTGDGWFSMNERIGGEPNLCSHLGPGFSTENFGNPLNSGCRTINDAKISKSEGRVAENIVDSIRCSTTSNKNFGYVSSVDGQVADDGRFRNDNWDGWFSMNERIGGEPNLCSHLGPGFSTENFGNPLTSSCRTINDAKISKSEGRVTENIVDSIRCSTTLNKNFGYVSSVDGEVADDGRFRNDNRVEIAERIDTFARPVISTECTSLSKMRQNSLVYPNTSHSTCHDATVARAVAYNPELARSHYLRFSSFAANGSSSSVQENPCHGSGGNHYFLSNSASPTYGLEAKGLSRRLDVASAYEHKAVLPTISDHSSQSPCGTANYFLNADLSNHVDLNSSAYLDYRCSSFPNPSSASLPRVETFERDKGSASYALNSMENPTFRKGENFPLTSRGMHQSLIYHEIGKTSAGQEFLCSAKQDLNLGMYHHEEDSLNYDNDDFKRSKENILDYEEHQRRSKTPSYDSSSNRRSVFSRLTSGPEAQVQEKEENDNYVCYDGCHMDSSVNEVMDSLQQGHNNRVREGEKPKKCKPFHSTFAYGESGLDEREIFVASNIEIDQSMKMRKMKEAYGAIDENMDEVPKETRVVDFKRRSETKKSFIETSTKTNPSIVEGKISRVNAEDDSLKDKSCKRRKLVRPAFTKNDSVDEGVVSNPSDNCDTVLTVHEAKMLNPDTRLSSVISKGSRKLGVTNIMSSFKSEGPKILKIGSLSSRSHKHEQGKETSNIPRNN